MRTTPRIPPVSPARAQAILEHDLEEIKGIPFGQAFAQVLADLSLEEIGVLRRRFFHEGNQRPGYAAVGRKLLMTPDEVFNAENAMLKKLRQAMPDGVPVLLESLEILRGRPAAL